MSIPLKSRNHFNFSASNKCRFLFKQIHFNLNSNEISKELLVNKFNMILNSQGRLSPMATKVSPATSYSKVTQRRWFGDIGCLSLVTFIEIWEATKHYTAELETFWTSRTSNLCQITAYILLVMCSLLSLDDLNSFYRSSHRRCSVKKGVLKNFANFTGKHLCWSFF